MRILSVTGSFPPMRCGIGDYTHQLALALSQEPDLEVAVLTSKSANSPSPDRRYKIFPAIESWEARELATVKEIVKIWSPDLVHIQYSGFGFGNKPLPWLLPLSSYLSGRPVVQTWHELFIPEPLRNPRRLIGFIVRSVVPGALVVVRENFARDTNMLLRWAFLNKRVQFIPSAASVPTISLDAAEKKAIRSCYARSGCQVIVFFGFIYPRKRVELLFEIADPKDSHIVIVGDGFSPEDMKNYPASVLHPYNAYFRSISALTKDARWSGKVTMTGFLPHDEAARVLASADAIVLPFIDGGDWNTSLHAAQAQGTFVLTTSTTRHGYDPGSNTYYAGEYDIAEMRRALRQYSGARTTTKAINSRAWQAIARSHIELYRTLIPNQPCHPAPARE